VLGILLVMSAHGPWGAPELSFLSQERALRGLLAQHDMIKDGQAIPAPASAEVSDEDQERLAHLLAYFNNRGANDRIAELFPGGEVTANERAEALGLTERSSPQAKTL